MKTIPNGVYPTMVTPFTDDLRIDFDALAPQMDWYETHGVTGLFALCSSSEITHLSFDERMQLLRALMKVRRSGTAILASGHVETEPAAFTREAQAFAAEGIDGYVFISSRVVFKEESDETFLRRLEAAAKVLGDIPLGIYECPSPYQRPLTPWLIERLPDAGNFAFSKDTCCNLEKIKIKLQAAKGTPLKLYNANTATLLESLRAGCEGFSGVMGNYHPQLYTKMYECYAENPALAERIQKFLTTISRMRGRFYPAEAKYYQYLEGVPMGYACRCKETAEFDEQERAKVAQMREKTLAFEQEIAGKK